MDTDTDTDTDRLQMTPRTPCFSCARNNTTVLEAAKSQIVNRKLWTWRLTIYDVEDCDA